MKKFTIFILLLVILGACGFTFFSMYANQSAVPNETIATTDTSVASALQPVNETASSTEYLESTTTTTTVSETLPQENCPTKAELLSKFSAPGTGFDDMYSRFRIRPVIGLMSESTRNDGDFVTFLDEEDLKNRKDLECFHKDTLAYSVTFDIGKSYLPQTPEDKMVAQVSTGDTVVNIYYPAMTNAGHYAAQRQIPGGYITYYVNELDRSEKEAVELLSKLIQATEVKVFSELTSKPGFSYETLIEEVDFYRILGPYVKIIYEAKDYVWLTLPHEGEGCQELIYLDKRTGEYKKTEHHLCWNNIGLVKDTPLYLFDVMRGINLDSGNKISIFDPEKILKPAETFTANCSDGNYGQNCFSDHRIEGNNLIVGIYKELHKPQWDGEDFDLTQPAEFENEKLREITIDLSQFY